jgi:hypothetical protein
LAAPIGLPEAPRRNRRPRREGGGEDGPAPEFAPGLGRRIGMLSPAAMQALNRAMLVFLGLAGPVRGSDS